MQVVVCVCVLFSRAIIIVVIVDVVFLLYLLLLFSEFLRSAHSYIWRRYIHMALKSNTNKEKVLRTKMAEIESERDRVKDSRSVKIIFSTCLSLF